MAGIVGFFVVRARAGDGCAPTAEEVDITIYLLDNATADEIRDLRRSVPDHPDVVNAVFVSKDDAWEEFKDIYEDQPEFFEDLPRDALPASIRITVVDGASAEEVASDFEGHPAVEVIRTAPHPRQPVQSVVRPGWQGWLDRLFDRACAQPSRP